jgi:hypothetical protein
MQSQGRRSHSAGDEGTFQVTGHAFADLFMPLSDVRSVIQEGTRLRLEVIE